MEPLDWPQPPRIDGPPADAAIDATQNYVKEVQNHVGNLRRNETDHRGLIDVMITALSEATKIFDAVYKEPGTSPGVRNDINKLQLQQAIRINRTKSHGPSEQDKDLLPIVNQDISEAADDSDSSSESTSGVVNNHKKGKPADSPEAREAKTARVRYSGKGLAQSNLLGMMDQVKLRLEQDFRDQGIRIPLRPCSMAGGQILLLTTSKYNAAILRKPTFWKPGLFGEDAHVVRPCQDKDTADNVTILPLQDLKKRQKAEKKARTDARLVWIKIPNHKFAKKELSKMDNNQIN
ncbi:MAG: hypothetical protein Q9226_007484 [Calogaya cf. arnoldii]